MRRFSRILLWGTVSLVVFLVVAFIGLRVYLGTDSARRMASDQIAIAIGGPVVVESLDAGAGSTSVTLTIPVAPTAQVVAANAADTAPTPPLFQGRIRVNASLLELATGQMPSRVTVEDGKLTLRLDANGDPIDQLPSPGDSGGGGGGSVIPAIELHNASVHIIQAGKPDFRIGGVNATLKPGSNGLTLTGTIDDPNWGKWTSCGEWASNGSTGAITLTTEGKLKIESERVRSIPMVPLDVWNQVGLNGGETPASVTIKRGATGWGWRVELEPQQTALSVPSIELDFPQAGGKVVIDGQKVELTGVQGQTADGNVTVSGVLDFASEPSKLHFDVAGQGLDIKKLPDSWGLPKQFTGKLQGSADLTLLLHANGKVEPLGNGTGRLEEATVLGFPAKRVEVRLSSDGKRYRFNTMTKSAQGNVIPAMFAATTLLLQTATPAAPPDPAPAATDSAVKAPTIVQANLALDDVDLTELIQRLEVKLPIRVAGKVNLNITAGIPTSNTSDIKLYRIFGTMTLPILQLDDLTLKDVVAKVRFRDGVLKVTELAANVPDPKRPTVTGRIAGTASFGIEPRSDLTAELTLATVPLGQIFNAIPSLTGSADGLVSGGLKLRLPGDKLTDIQAAEADGTLSSDALTVLGRTVGKTLFVMKLREGVASITEANTIVEGLPISGTASVSLTDKLAFTASLDTKPLDVVSIRKLVPEAALPFDVTGKLGVTAKATGTLDPLDYTVTGTANSSDLTIGTGHLSKLTFAWGVKPTGVTVSNLSAAGYEGKLTGSVDVPFTGNGDFKVVLNDVDARLIAKDIPSLPLKLEGKLSGTISGGIPSASAPASGTTPAVVTATPPPPAPPIKVDIQAPMLRVQGIPTRRLTGDVTYKPGSLVYKLAGDVFGGAFKLDGTYPLNESPKSSDKKPPVPVPGSPATVQPVSAIQPVPVPKAAPYGGTFRLTAVQLDRLGEELRMEVLRPLRGRVNVAWDYTFEPGGGVPIGTGRMELIDVGWGTHIHEQLNAVIPLRVYEEGVEVREISARVLGGELRGRARFRYGDINRGFFSVSLNRANLDEVLAPLGVPTSDAPVTITLQGIFGRLYRGSGAIAVDRGKLAGFEVNELRLPFDWSYTPLVGGTISLRDLTAQAGGGRLTGSGTYSWGNVSRLEVKTRFSDVSIRQVLGRVPGVKAGHATGRIELSGNDIESIHDLTGFITAEFGETSLGDAPVVRILSQYLAPLRLRTPFDKGELRGRLAKGIFRLERLSLNGSLLNMFVDGTIGLNGKLDLDVLVQTNALNLNSTVLRLFRVKLPPIGPIPLTLALEISRYLSNRVIRFDVTGTIGHPSVQVNAIGILAEEAIRYFLGVYDVSRR